MPYPCNQRFEVNTKMKKGVAVAAVAVVGVKMANKSK
jgi:hypothetical protein